MSAPDWDSLARTLDDDELLDELGKHDAEKRPGFYSAHPALAVRMAEIIGGEGGERFLALVAEQRSRAERLAAGEALPLLVKEKLPEDRIERARLRFGTHVTAGVVNNLTSFIRGEIAELAVPYTADFLDKAAPKDPIEELLHQQLLMTHARIVDLSQKASVSELSPKNRHLLHNAADGATNTFRRLVLALAEYRQPRRAVFIKQSNTASQQLVQNFLENSEGGESANELGSRPEAQALPAHAGGLALPAATGAEGSTLGALDRAANCSGEDAFEAELVQARTQKRGASGRAAKGAGSVGEPSSVASRSARGVRR